MTEESNKGAATEPFGDADPYFKSYAHSGIHDDMLRDEVRTFAYRDAMLKNKHLFKGKIVLDVGCGSGVLSLFAAKSGARHVYAVDCSSIAAYAKEIIECNNMSKTITVLNSKIEETELPVKNVDIIISEWMGYCLLYESMLESVIYARDKWLAPDGHMFPDEATLFVCAIEDAYYKEQKVSWWDNVYGFNMSPMRPLVMSEPFVDVVDIKSVVTGYYPFLNINLKTIKIEDLTCMSGEFALKCSRDDYIHAVVLYFGVRFNACHSKTGFTTSPADRPTHWKQSIFYLNGDIICKKGEWLKGNIVLSQNKHNKRNLNFEITASFKGVLCELDEKNYYFMK